MGKRTTVSFATCNLLNLNQPEKPIYFGDGWTHDQHEAKVEFLGGVVDRLRADAWGFQELWHRESLRQVFERAELDDEYTLLVPDDLDGDGGIVCAGAVRTEILEGEHEWISDFPEKYTLQSGGDDEQTPEIAVELNGFSRPVLCYQVRPRAKSKPITVYVAHLKSKRPTPIYREGWYRDDDEYYRKHTEGLGAALATIRRTAEAAALRMLITDRFKGNSNPVVVLGDLNDNAHSNTLNIISGQPKYLTRPWAKGGSDVDLYSTGALQALRSLRDVYYTHVFQEVRETLDHILVSQELYDYSRERVWGFRSMEIVNDHLNRHDHRESGTTDHGVVWAEFEYRPAHD